MAKKKIYVAKFNQRVVFYDSKNNRTQSGGAKPVKVKIWETSANVEPLKSSRVLQAAQTQLVDGFTIRVRDRRDKDIKPDTTIYYRDGWLSIISCIPDFVYNDIMVIIAIWSRRPIRLSGRIWDNDLGFNKGFTYVSK